ncbi:MAG TPA: amidase [Ramlibacter sp.]|nr:amidase [Ramlibacter sp.]
MPTHRLPAPTAVETALAIARGQQTARTCVEAALERIAQLEPQLHAWQHLDPEGARRRADAFDRQRAQGLQPGPLGGVPLAVKDIFDTQDLPTRYGSPIYDGHQPARDADVVAASRQAGAIVLGKTVTTEFAYFTPGPTANPWNTAHTPGGSSSGSAAAVASGMVPLALGSQTAGSLIRPASYCGVFALKPSHGRFSLGGVKPFAPSLDTLGWLARSADDLEMMRAALAGEAFRPLEAVAPRQLRLACSPTYEWSASDAAGRQAWAQAQERASAAGVALATIELPASYAELQQAQRLVMGHEAAQSLRDEQRRHPDMLSPALRDLIAAGLATTSADYQRALARAREALQQFDHLLGEASALMVPAATGEAPSGLAATGDPVFSRVWTLLGLPCVNVPGLLGPNGLPIGIQLVGRMGRERELLQAAESLGQVLAAASS